VKKQRKYPKMSVLNRVGEAFWRSYTVALILGVLLSMVLNNRGLSPVRNIKEWLGW